MGVCGEEDTEPPQFISSISTCMFIQHNQQNLRTQLLTLTHLYRFDKRQRCSISMDTCHRKAPIYIFFICKTSKSDRSKDIFNEWTTQKRTRLIVTCFVHIHTHSDFLQNISASENVFWSLVLQNAKWTVKWKEDRHKFRLVTKTWGLSKNGLEKINSNKRWDSQTEEFHDSCNYLFITILVNILETGSIKSTNLFSDQVPYEKNMWTCE